MSCRKFLNVLLLAVFLGFMTASGALAQIEGGSLDPDDVPKYVMPLVKPPVMPRETKINQQMDKNIEYYEIAVRQFQQQILPPVPPIGGGANLPKTTVWSYGPANESIGDNLGKHVTQGGHYFYPAFTIEAKYNMPVRVKWVNELKHSNGYYRSHLLPIDPTLHWANPPGGNAGRDMRPDFAGKTYVPLAEFTNPNTQYTQYTGPVPIVTHLHGAVGVGDESDGYAETWFLPDANNIPATYAKEGTWYNFFKNKAQTKFGQNWGPGFAVFQYPNNQRAGTLWYHDHSLGMTRNNVYAGPAGFYLVRGGPSDKVLDSRTGLPAVLPLPRPGPGINPFGTFYEIPIAIQDRSFNDDGSLFYPDSRDFFGDPVGASFIPFTDLSPIWNPEFFGNMMVVNGQTWPFLTVEKRRYRFRLLNGCQSRFLILDFSEIINEGGEVWQIGTEGGFLPAPLNISNFLAPNQNRILLGLAERADIIVDFTNVPAGNYVLGNVGPDEPFGGGIPGDDFPVADPNTTGQVMQFRVVPAVAADPTTPPQFLQFPAITNLAGGGARHVALLEVESSEGGPAAALLGTFNPATGVATEKLWMDAVTENPAVGTTEVWNIYNNTVDAHPIHIHEIHFQVVNRQALDSETNLPTGPVWAPEPWENGSFKDTVIAYPGEVTRVRGKFGVSGLFVWHCHIVEHEDNEMMRPYFIGTGPATSGVKKPYNDYITALGRSLF